jgi:tetratricopeptide (TPR) repeat protein
MMRKEMRVLGACVCVIIMAAFSGCAATPGSNINTGNEQAEGAIPWPDGVYYPNFQSGIDTIDAARKDLAGLLGNKQSMDDNVGVEYFGQLDFNKPANQDNPANYLKGTNAYVILFNTKGEFIYMLPRNAINVLDDRIYVSPVLTIFYTDLFDSQISVEKSRDEKIHISWVSPVNWTRDNEAWSGKYVNLDLYRRSYRRPYVIHCSGLISFFFKYQADAEKFADNLFFIQQTLKKQHEERRVFFESKAAQYRALTIKPPISEEQRKQIVLANVLNQNKDYAGAIDLYLKAIDLDPVSYPGAYFNLALLSAQLQRFNMAIAYMKQYLMLVPDAPDARSAQDKIYEWEYLLQRTQQGQ